MPSTIRLAMSFGSANAVPARPGTRALMAGMALNRCVTPVRPSPIARTISAAVASLWPAHTRIPRDESSRMKPTGTLVVALEPFDVAVTFERQHVRGDAIEKPPVVADDHGATGEIFQRRLKGAQRSEEHTSELQSRLHLVCRL